jgi:prepilin-type N-terminal cleavage/methylation domain-containing protein
MQTPRTRLPRLRGFSLTEVLVASAILVIIMAGALMLYERGSLIFKQGNEASEMQQNTRVAYDRMLADVRMAGFDYLRPGMVTAAQQIGIWLPNQTYSAGTLVVPPTANGHTYRAKALGTSGGGPVSWPTGIGGESAMDGGVSGVGGVIWKENGGAVYEQPDEQIEYAGQSAITIRANFDYSANEPGDGDHGRETNLETTQFPIVTTGNDEIVTYALVSNTASANGDTITFFADVNNGLPPSRAAYPGGSVERPISIPNVDLSNNHPPYTLYRFTLDNAGSVVRTPLADNIRSLTILYFMDSAATTPLTDTNSPAAPAPNIGGVGQFDPMNPGAIVTGRVIRARIRSMRVRLIGMNAVSDVNYSDTSTANGILSTAGTLASDTVAPNFRRMTMDTMIVPRNLGLKGMPLILSSPPLPPTITSVCYGYCGIAVVNWTPNPASPMSSYVVQWDTSATGSFSASASAGTGNSWAVDLTQGNLSNATTYYFRVLAQNDAGTALSTNVVSASVANATKPGTPSNFAATYGPAGTGVSGIVNLTWSAPTGNDAASAAPSCTGGATPANASFYREVQGYRIYRDTTNNFTPSPATLILSETATGAGAPISDAYGNFHWSDTTTQSCVHYYYRIQTVEWCAAADADNTTNDKNTALSAMLPVTSSNGLDGSTAMATPQFPLNLIVDAANSSCTSGTCSITLNWAKVSQDMSSQPINIGTYNVRRQKFKVTAPATQIGGDQIFPVSNTNSIVVWQDAPLPQFDPSDSVLYTYKYDVQATQPNPCVNSAWSAKVPFPPPCVFTGAVIVESGAASGSGSFADPWVMNAGDTLKVNAPGGTTFTQTLMDIYTTGGGFISDTPSAATPALFTWNDLTAGTKYSVQFTMTSTTGCVQQLTSYVTQETPVGCVLTVGSSSVLALLNGSPTSSTTAIIRVDLINASTSALTLQSIDIGYTIPQRIIWDNVGFPSGGVYSIGVGSSSASASGSVTLTLSPKPAALAAADVTVPANGTRSVTLRMHKTNGNPTITTSAVSSICVHYTRPDVVGQVFLCKIVPSAGAGNPFTCN